MVNLLYFQKIQLQRNITLILNVMVVKNGLRYLVDKVDHAVFHTIAGEITGEDMHYNDANSRISQMNEIEKRQFFELVNDIEVRKKVIKIIGFEE